MQITGLEPIVLRYPLDEPLPPSAARPETAELDIHLIRLDTDEGPPAYGEAWLKNELDLAAAADFFAGTIGDADVLDRGLLFHRMMTRLGELAPEAAEATVRDYCAVLSAIDTALWDLAGRQLGVSVARLLGGVRTRRMDSYITGLYLESFQTLEKKARSFVEDGWWALKLKLNGDLQRDIETVNALRKSLGNQVVVMADANGAYETYDEAREMGAVLGKNDIFWFEEPMAAGSWEEYAKLAQVVEPPIAGGETLYGVRPFYNALSRKSMHVVMPDPRLCGGISAIEIIAGMARLFDTRLSLHSWISPIALMAAANITAALPYATYLELDSHTPALLEEIFEDPPEFDHGFLLFEDKPGLGVTVAEGFIEKHRQRPRDPAKEDSQEAAEEER
ncbi:MAG: mandelate racemase/muconate lactonizing enzyme family protein [Armatimonadota bacterium]